MELLRPPGHSHFLSATLPWTILQGRIESLGKNSNTHFSSTSQDTCLQIFPINHEVIATRNSSKGQPDLLRIAPILKKQFNYHNHLCWVASEYRKWSRALNSYAPATGQAPSIRSWVFCSSIVAFLALGSAVRFSFSLPSPDVGRWNCKVWEWWMLHEASIVVGHYFLLENPSFLSSWFWNVSLVPDCLCPIHLRFAICPEAFVT